MLSRASDEPKKTVKYVLDVGSIVAQLIGFFIWPLTVTSTRSIWFIPLSLFFVSFHWWENYVTKCSPLSKVPKLLNVLLRWFINFYFSFRLKKRFNISQKLRTKSTNHATRFISSSRLTKSCYSLSVACFCRKVTSTTFSQTSSMASEITR